jgi:transcriptional regulator with XRE-family HTH domain
MSIPFNRWVKETRQGLGLTQQECADRVIAAFPKVTVINDQGEPGEREPISRSGWAWFEKYTARRVDPATIQKVAIGLGLPVETVAAQAPQYVTETSEYDRFLLEVGKNITRAREGRCTQEELARRLGVGRSKLTEYETGTSEPTLFHIKNIAVELGVTTDMLLGIGERHDAPPTDFAEQDEDRRMLREIYDIVQKFDRILQLAPTI